jgi:hypothetical protein
MVDNKMEIIAQLFGKRLGEKFTVKRDNMMFDCRFTKHGLDTFGVYENPYMSFDAFILEELLTGRVVIVDE